MRAARRRPFAVSAVLAIAAASSIVVARASEARSAATCLGASSVVRLSGTHRTEVRYPSPANETTFDGRSATFLAYPYQSLYPFSVGKKSAPSRTCVVGGLVIGQQPRSLTWDQMKDAYDGDGLRVAGSERTSVDGLRVDNVEDGVAPRGTEDRYPKDGDGLVMRNLYFTYIRDDCVENDDIAGGVISDSLFDGCYTGVSERPGSGNPQLDHPAPRGEKLLLDHVLLRLQAMPGPRDTRDRTVLGHGQLFKWSPVANSLVVRHSVFLVEKAPNSSSYFPFPRGTVTEDVTIVWLGSGDFGWAVPRGTTVTSDRSVWDRARAIWLTRHGCPSFTSCSRLYAPAPIPSRTRSAGPPSLSPTLLPSMSRSEIASAAGAPPATDSLPRLPLAVAILALVVSVGLLAMVKGSNRMATAAVERAARTERPGS